VRLTGSGISCPDWPLCYGLWFPTPAKLAALGGIDYSFAQVMFEWTHRFNAAVVVGPLTLALALVAWRRRRDIAGLWPISIAALVVLLIQGALGGFTVLDRNSPWSVAVHLSVALVFLALLVWACLSTYGPPERRHGRAGALIAAGALAALATMASGAMMAKSGATLACAGWPLCDGAWLPDLSDPLIRLHFGHRVLALLTVVLVLVLAATVRTGTMVRAARWTAAIVAIQVLAGAVVIDVFARDSLPNQAVVGAMHQAIGVALFATLAWGLWAAWGPRHEP
jgi:heme A synthase